MGFTIEKAANKHKMIQATTLSHDQQQRSEHEILAMDVYYESVAKMAPYTRAAQARSAIWP